MFKGQLGKIFQKLAGSEVLEKIPGFMASAYDKAASMAIGSYYSVVANEIVSAIDSGIILDLGTGPGYLPLAVVKEGSCYPSCWHRLNSPADKNSGENSAQADVADRVGFEVMNATKLRFENDTFDMVFGGGGMLSCSQKRRFTLARL